MAGTAGRFLLLFTPLLLLAGGQALTAQGAPDYAPQGWTEADRQFWYTTTQGSRLMPLSWLRALERAEDSGPFLSAANMDRFRYLVFTTPTDSRASEDRLPVGFAIDRQDDRRFRRTQLRWLPQQGNAEPWAGFTCSACHTNEIEANGRRYRIDGAPSLAYFQWFSDELDGALTATRRTAGKWDRFTLAILGEAANRAQENRDRLARAVDQHIANRADVAGMNQAGIRDGFARVDAFGHIFNQASLFSGARRPTAHPSTAPVSYPFLWNVPQHDRLQWNGSVSSQRVSVGQFTFDFGAVGRNAGEVIGVFGEVTIDGPLALVYDSSVNIVNLAELEVRLQRLQPPAWPAGLLGTIDEPARRRGEDIFARMCSGCHAPLDRRDLGTRIVADMSYFGTNAPARAPLVAGGPATPNIPPWTDPLMACNAFTRTANTGFLRFHSYDNGHGARPLRADDSLVGMLTVMVKGAMTRKATELLNAIVRLRGQHLPPPGPAVDMVRQQPPAATPPGDPFPSLPALYRQCVDYRWTGQEAAILGYKARPLTGIWATAPYLHNGSVPNLYQLLLPPERRMQTFFLGTRRYDSADLGFETSRTAENWFEYRTRDPEGNIVWGNFNGGHDYGNAALDRGTDRRDLLEYLKSL